ncbi:hypothetical protein AAC978_11385 [Desulfitobacterium sp. THU1]|uniref:hypothetical protein n=1 Tax=Desulfitobacterium sp. THU1 TaxID=3138072 RepID=UPI00311F9AF7
MKKNYSFLFIVIIISSIFFTGCTKEVETAAQLSEFKQEVDQDIAESFNLSLEDLNLMDEMQLNHKEQQYATTMAKVLTQVRNNQDYGDIKESVYLNQDGKNGYIFAKKADGTNYLYTIAYNQGWAIVKTDTIQGKDFSLDDTVRKEKSYSALTEAQLQKYLEENNISPLAVQNIGKFTVVLYKAKLEGKSVLEKALTPKSIRIFDRACYLSSDQDGNIYAGGGGGGDNSDFVPVTIGSGGGMSEIGNIGYSYVIINDIDILKNAYTVNCSYDNNSTTTTLVDNQNAFIIPFPEERVELINVIVSDKDGRVLFDNKELLKTGIGK